MPPITPRFRFRRRSVTLSPTTRRHLQAEVTSETRDGVTARVLVGFTRDTLLPESLPETLPETSDAIALDAVENALSTYLRSLRSSALPRPGKRLKDLEELLKPHELIDDVFVVSTEIEVTERARELAAR